MIHIGEYSYDEKDILGQGDKGITYKGFNKNKYPVAIKVLYEDNTNEIHVLKKLSEGYTSNFVMVYYNDFLYEEVRYIILEYIDGVSLKMYKDRLNEPLFLWNIINQLLLGLQFIHNKGCAHGDIYNENIMITSKNVIKYIDFGSGCVDKCSKIQSIDMTRLHYLLKDLCLDEGEYNYDDGRTISFLRKGVININSFYEMMSIPYQGKEVILGFEHILFKIQNKLFIASDDMKQLADLYDTINNIYSDDIKMTQFIEVLKITFEDNIQPGNFPPPQHIFKQFYSLYKQILYTDHSRT